MILPKRYDQHEHGQRIIQRIKLRRRIAAARDRLGKLEAALAEVGQETGLSRSALFEAWSCDERKAIIEASRYGWDPLTTKSRRNRKFVRTRILQTTST